MKILGTILLFLSIILTGCIPLTQENVVGGRRFDHFTYLSDEYCGLLQLGPSNNRNTNQILDRRSYAISPRGTRFAISIQPHPYDLEAGHLNVRNRVYLLNSNGQRVTKHWENGQWKFHFALQTSRGLQTREFELDLSTFHYNPLLHGAPN